LKSNKNTTITDSLSDEELECLYKIKNSFSLIKKSVIKINSLKSEIDEYVENIKEINFDIEVIEDPISRPLGTGLENRRLELLIRGLEADVKLMESQIHDSQCQIIKHEILIKKYESHINREQSNLRTMVSAYRKALLSKYESGSGTNNVTKF